jgi:small neutral amino acid transporter SnatA (MarC family)
MALDKKERKELSWRKAKDCVYDFFIIFSSIELGNYIHKILAYRLPPEPFSKTAQLLNKKVLGVSLPTFVFAGLGVFVTIAKDHNSVRIQSLKDKKNIDRPENQILPLPQATPTSTEWLGRIKQDSPDKEVVSSHSR